MSTTGRKFSALILLTFALGAFGAFSGQAQGAPKRPASTPIPAAPKGPLEYPANIARNNSFSHVESPMNT